LARLKQLVPPPLAGLILLVAVACLLELAVRSDFISPTIVARPSDAIAGLVTLQSKVDFLGATRITFGIVAIAILLECVVALPLGYFLFRRRDFGQAYSGWLAALFAAPIFLLYPLFMVIFGRNQLTLVIMGFLSGVTPLIIQAEQGFLSVSQTMINVGMSFDLTRWQIFWKIMFPAAAPSIFTGFRLSLMYTLINVIAIEYLVNVGGLGVIVSDRYFRFDIAGTYSAIITVTAISVLFNWLIGRLEHFIRPI
jgi:ABC-type nitrate/sulfonate/bicarbonate transport system permease component